MTCDLMGREGAGCSGQHTGCVCHRRQHRAALLINLGTPDSPAVGDVRRYLREFLSDPFVIKLPGAWRPLTPALGAMIAHFRGPQSAEAYRSIWWENGSPLRVITARQEAALSERLGGDWSVYHAMRYGNPGIGAVLRQMTADGVTDVVVVPMYPQWAGPTTGTAMERLYAELRRQGLRLNLTVRTEWYDDRAYLDAQAGLLHRFLGERGFSPDDAFLLFSAHSMPVSYIRDGDPYESHIRRTTELVRRLLDWPQERTALSFQSKLGPVAWLAPSTEATLAELADRGEQRVVVCPISFTADCLETVEEIGIRYAETFAQRSGGGQAHVTPSLNDDDAFIAALASPVRRGPRPVGAHETIHPLPPARREPLATLADRLVMVGVAAPGRLEDAAEGQFVDEPTLHNLRRERLHVLELVRDCARLPQVDGCLILNTCQRCELYALLARGAPASEALPELQSRLAAGMDADFEPMSLAGPAAHRRLLRIALGLNSTLPGDADVIEQLRSAQRMAEHVGSMSTGLRRLLEEVEREAAAIRKDTSWADFMTEFTSAAMESLDPGAGAGGEVVIIGGSTTSRQLLRALAADGTLSSDRLTFIYRGAARKDLVKFIRHVAPHVRRLCVTRYDAPEALDAIAQADTVLLGIDARQPVLRREQLALLRDFRKRPLLIVDFNSFGSTEGVASLEGVRLLCADKVQEAATRHADRTMSRPGFDGAFAEACRAVDAAAGVGELRDEGVGATSHRLPVIDRGTFARYSGLSLPRHVAYPMPTWWRNVTEDEAAQLRRLSAKRQPARDLSLYLHLPFCERMCRFCACNRTILRRDGASSQGRVERYLDAIIEEQRGAAETIGTLAGGEGGGERRIVRQVHWGGGTPTYLNCDQIERLHRATFELFAIHPDAEISIEIDPRVTSTQQLQTLRQLGFNRVSLGVQDFDPAVQEHIGRVQPFEMVEQAVATARAAGFASVNFDLIYGLPRQSVESVARTIEQTIRLAPDRIAFYHYAQVPDRVANQRGLDHTALPDSDAKLTMLLEAAERFGEAGYEFIGLDHFARPDELLARAKRAGEINRSFQGMTTGAELDLFGFGCSAISILPRTMYLQNVHDVNTYVEQSLSGAETAVRGMELTADDAVRQAALMQLYCHAEIDPDRLLRETGEHFATRFAAERAPLDRLAADGLIEWTEAGGIRLTHPLGRVLMRNVAAVFDAYLDPEAPWNGMSRTFSTSA